MSQIFHCFSFFSYAMCNWSIPLPFRFFSVLFFGVFVSIGSYHIALVNLKLTIQTIWPQTWYNFPASYFQVLE